MRVTWLPSTLATHKSSPSWLARNAMRLPSLEMAHSPMVICDGCLTRRWMSSISKSLPAGALGAAGLNRLITKGLLMFRRHWLMKAMRLFCLLQVTPPLYVANRVMLRAGFCLVGPVAGIRYSSLAKLASLLAMQIHCPSGDHS